MNQEVWCFLVSGNKYLDYRTVVAPNFMREQNYTLILARVAEGEITDEGTAYYRKIINSKVGDLTLVFRIIEALEIDIGISGDGVLKDSFGRVISLIEGFVFKGDFPAKNLVVTSEDFDKIHQQIIEYYQQFWHETSPIPAYASQSFSLSEKEKDDNPFQLIKLENYIAGNKPQKQAKLVTNEQLSENEKFKEESLGDRSIPPSWQFNIIKEFIDENRFGLEINSIAISPNRQEIAIRYDQNKIVIQSLESFEERTLLYEIELLVGNATPIIIDSTGKFLVTSVIERFDDNIIKLWDLNTEEFKQLGSNGISGFNRVQAVAFHPDSETVITGGSDGKIKLWDATVTGEITTQPIPKHDTQIRCMAVDKKNNILASGDKQGNIKIWELGVGSLTEKMTISADTRSINSLAFSPNGKILATGGDNCIIKLWNAETGELYDRHQRKHSAIVNSVAFSSDGKLIASGDDDGNIKIWSLKSQTAVFVGNKHTKAVTSVVFTRDGKLISGGKDGKLITWEQIK
ncbi:WD40 repeat domain-containing protein [Okeania sp. KiyG1]|uniref:WD40 repeat domain-containing protein n=1 Tax=Okeania sp. KiyG1 TaxID=2720165 RepID=UPI0019242960|nr:WD40 repeat domain-containing protein [Okeania sp. KiyG1]GFZ94958.1 hypothetical protein CYANOKiyG1_05970 [Okeania sp. KiyG1]